MFFNFLKNKKVDECCNNMGAVVNGSPIAQFLIDEHHRVVYWNKALAEYSGIKEKDVVGTNSHWKAFYSYERPCLADLLVDQKTSLIPQLYKGKYAKSKLVEGAYEATDFFGEMTGKGKWLYFTAAAILDGAGKIVGAVETLEDITERKKAEELLEKQTAKLQESKKALIEVVKELKEKRAKLGEAKAIDEAILMSIGDGLVITDTEGKIVFFNDPFGKLIGWTKREAAGKHLAEVMPCQDEKGRVISESRRFIKRVIKGEKPSTSIFYYVRKDGSRFPGAVTVSSIDFEGKKLGAVSVIRDVTKEMEMDRSKSEFISLASHQLRDAPTAISWCAEALLAGVQGQLSDEQKEYVQEIYDRNKSAIGLINDLLNMSRIDLGTFVIEPEEISLKDVCANEIKQFAAIIKEKQLEVNEVYNGDVPIIKADPQLTQIVFQNLISNAIHYTPKGGKITASLDLSKKKEIIFSVKDTGYGIPKEQQPKIFTRMFRADNAKKVRSGGSGLGLYVVKTITNQAGWEISFESKEDQGTTFYVNIPISGMAKRGGETRLTRGVTN